MTGWWGQVWPNLVASAIWAAPAFVVQHVLLRRHTDRRHEQMHDRLTALIGPPTPDEET